jgi:hypothetical protein
MASLQSTNTSLSPTARLASFPQLHSRVLLGSCLHILPRAFGARSFSVTGQPYRDQAHKVCLDTSRYFVSTYALLHIHSLYSSVFLGDVTVFEMLLIKSRVSGLGDPSFTVNAHNDNDVSNNNNSPGLVPNGVLDNAHDSAK